MHERQGLEKRAIVQRQVRYPADIESTDALGFQVTQRLFSKEIVEQSANRTQLSEEQFCTNLDKRRGKKSHVTHREWGKVQGGEVGQTNGSVPPFQGGISPSAAPLLHKFVRVPRLGRCIWVRRVNGFLGEIGEQSQRKGVVAPSLWSEILLWAYLEEAP